MKNIALSSVMGSLEALPRMTAVFTVLVYSWSSLSWSCVSTVQDTWRCITHDSLSMYLQGGAKNGAILSHCEYSENSITKLRTNIANIFLLYSL